MKTNKSRFQGLLETINKASNTDLTDNIFNLYSEWVELCKKTNTRASSYVYTDPVNKIYACRFNAEEKESDSYYFSVTFYIDEYDEEDGCVSIEYSVDNKNVDFYHNELENYLNNVIKVLKINE